MKGDAQPLIKFFDGSDKRFIIPLYQRNYDWKEENCEQLFQDLMKLHNSKRKSHFFGSIVSSIQPGTEDRFIIDGQQRITTVSLLLIAMVNAKKEGLIETTDTKIVEKIFSPYQYSVSTNLGNICGCIILLIHLLLQAYIDTQNL